MMPSRRRTARLVAATVQAQAATWTTLGFRVPKLLGGTLSPAESARMVSEKVAAMSESSQAVARTAARLASSQNGRAPTPGAVMSGWLALAEAASEPFHKRVTANAKRLGGSRKGRSG